MAINQTFDKIRPRRGSKDNWTARNPVLLEGELGIEYPNDGIASRNSHIRFKVGDGVTEWNELPYCADPTECATIIGGTPTGDHLISIKTGTTAEWNMTDPVLEEGEIVFDITLGEIKVGDGIHHFSELRYIGETWDRTHIYDFGDYDADEI